MKIEKLLQNIGGIVTIEVKGFKVTGDLSKTEFKPIRVEYTAEQVDRILQAHAADLCDLKNKNQIMVSPNMGYDQRTEEPQFNGFTCTVAQGAT